MNAKAKGARAELRCIKLLERWGFACTRAGASLGMFDVIGLHPWFGAVFVQVKSGTARLSRKDRAALEGGFPNYFGEIAIEYWHWDRAWDIRERFSPVERQWNRLSTDSFVEKAGS